MKWFKHISDSLTDPDICDILDEFGSDGYLAFFGTLELIARNWNQNQDGFIYFSWKFIHRSTRLSPKKYQTLITSVFFSKRFTSKIDSSGLWIKCHKFNEYMDNWTDRQTKLLCSNSVVTTEQLPNHIEEEEEGEVEDIKIKNIVETPKTRSRQKSKILTEQEPKSRRDLENIPDYEIFIDWYYQIFYPNKYFVPCSDSKQDHANFHRLAKNYKFPVLKNRIKAIENELTKDKQFRAHWLLQKTDSVTINLGLLVKLWNDFPQIMETYKKDKGIK